MAYKSMDLCVLAYANGFTLWNYQTPDSDILELGYFDGNANQLLRRGDMIIAQTSIDKEMENGIYTVARSDESGVVIMPFLNQSAVGAQ